VAPALTRAAALASLRALCAERPLRVLARAEDDGQRVLARALGETGATELARAPTAVLWSLAPISRGARGARGGAPGAGR
jgi:hypothetical protein